MIHMIHIAAAGMLSALGAGATETADNLASGRAPGLMPGDDWLFDGTTVVARVPGDGTSLPDALCAHDSRNNRLLLAALEQIRPQVDRALARHGHDRVAVVMGTSTAGQDEANRHYFQRHGDAADWPRMAASGFRYVQQEFGDPADFLSRHLGTTGPAYAISTACSSSGRAIVSAVRLLRAGLADAAIVGGADTLNHTTVNGFASLGLVSSQLCRPFSRERDGVTIGEGAALLLLTRDEGDVGIFGVGESSDAFHMSSPHPEGAGADAAMRMALDDAGLAPGDIGYINLHGTATPANDKVESATIHRLFADAAPCSSVKHLVGHTLGAAGALEVALCWLVLTRDLPLPPQDFSNATPDDSLPSFGLLQSPGRLDRQVIMSNAFAFGGNNTSIILGAAS